MYRAAASCSIAISWCWNLSRYEMTSLGSFAWCGLHAASGSANSFLSRKRELGMSRSIFETDIRDSDREGRLEKARCTEPFPIPFPINSERGIWHFGPSRPCRLRLVSDLVSDFVSDSSETSSQTSAHTLLYPTTMLFERGISHFGLAHGGVTQPKGSSYNLHGCELHGPSSKGTKLLFQVIKALTNENILFVIETIELAHDSIIWPALFTCLSWSWTRFLSIIDSKNRF